MTTALVRIGGPAMHKRVSTPAQLRALDAAWRSSRNGRSAAMSVKDRLLGRVEVDCVSGCWLWRGAVNSKGYGQIRIGNRTRYAHRLSFEEHVGPIRDGLWVLHRCDVRSCVNPAHLFLGTTQENTADMISKGRQRIAGSKLLEFRGKSQSRRDWAAQVGLSEDTIQRRLAKGWSIERSITTPPWNGRRTRGGVDAP